ncbi:superoxide dismutase, Fe-Mn family [Aneurinibacillus thermoaerophilus]|uniref:Superoxide dismutase n=2 Tax=Aneurinibacillus thermoaerophilus TaxID=143495 RepID=A0A1G8BXE3_ANETH|nr:superoxide dismutase, Fe-Mn family [Aneurinibacillus thermoaerophilus]
MRKILYGTVAGAVLLTGIAYATTNAQSSTVPVSEQMATKTVPIGEHKLPPLPYAYNALEPYIDEKTMRLHHDIHHKSYVDGLNKAEKEMQKARETGDYALIKHWEREAAFNGSGHYLHTIFWNNMKPKGGGVPKGELAEEINKTFGSFEKFKAHFSAAAEKVEGSGWALLVWSPEAGRLEILQAEKHQNLTQQGVIPLLVLDVWEHAYYLKYNNKRAEYIKAWWNVVNWDDVSKRYKEAVKK